MRVQSALEPESDLDMRTNNSGEFEMPIVLDAELWGIEKGTSERSGNSMERTQYQPTWNLLCERYES